MRIDIHRHSRNPGKSHRVLRNLFHNQGHEMEHGLYYSMGLHPWHIRSETLEEDLKQVAQHANNEQVIAIGETGLDKAIKIPLDMQKKAFETQIQYALELDKPMIIHCVKAYNEILELKKYYRHKKPWIIHWYNASPQTGKQLVKNDFYLSFGHLLFHERSKAYKTFLDLPPERIFFETDDSERSIDEVYKKAAKARGISSRNLEMQTEQNFKSCFGIDP